MELTTQPQTAPKNELNIQELKWDEVRDHVKISNLELFKTIEAIDPNEKKLTFIKARYPYGAKIIKNGILHLPFKSGCSFPITSTNINKKIQNKLLYSPIPLGLLLNKASEVSVENDGHHIPLRLMAPGCLFGLFEVTAILSGLQPAPPWCVTSGGNLFLLPRIADKSGYQRIKKKLNIALNSPQTLADHTRLFTEITNQPQFINDWYSDVLYFTDAWFKKPYNDPQWFAFYSYLFKESNVPAQAAQNERIINIIWQCLATAIGNRNLRPRPYIVDTVKHLVAVASGVFPAFKPADQSQIVAPTKLIQDIFIHPYGLKNHLPTLMHIESFSSTPKSAPVYYSLNYPTLLEGAPQLRSYPDIIADLREIKLLTDTLYAAIEKGRVILPLARNLLKAIEFNYFHSEVDIYNEIKPAREIAIDDTRFVNDKETLPDREFCATSPFFSGCIRISCSHNE